MRIYKQTVGKGIAFLTISALVTFFSVQTSVAATTAPTLVKVLTTSGGGNTTFFVAGAKMYFSLYDAVLNEDELWSSDGTASGTQKIKAINSTGSSANMSGFTQFNSKVYFQADDGVSGAELWVTDGTADGTFMLKDINASEGSYPSDLQVTQSKLQFQARDGNGTEIWETDGTPDGTVIVKDISGSNSVPLTAPSLKLPKNLMGGYVFIKVKAKTFFQASDASHGSELWVMDGTNVGTAHLVRDINPKGDALDSNDSPFLNTTFYSMGSKIYFRATDGKHGYELWSSDGTSNGTQMVKDINPKGDGIIFAGISSTVFNSKLYLWAIDGHNQFGSLWVTDGTPAGTQAVKVASGYDYSHQPIIFRSALYMTVSDGKHGIQLVKISR